MGKLPIINGQTIVSGMGKRNDLFKGKNGLKGGLT